MTEHNPSDNMQNRINNIFAGSDVPSPASLKEMEALRNRIQELEANLKLQEQRTEMAAKEAHQNKKQIVTDDASSSTPKVIDSIPSKQSWLTKFWNLIVDAHPSITDARERNTARLAASFLFVIFLLEMNGGIVRTIHTSFANAFSGTFLLSIIATLTSYILSRTKWIRASIFIFAMFFSSLAYFTIATQGLAVNTSTVIFVYVPLSLIVASAFLSSWAVFALIVLNILTYYLTVKVHLPAMPEGFVVQLGIITTMGMVLILLTNFRKRSELQSLQEIKSANDELQVANEELISSRDQLEQRVQERTRDLELASEVGRTVTVKVDSLYQLLSDAVEQIRSRFNLYYTQVYLTDRAGRTITLRAGTGEVGKQLTQRGHQLLISNDSLNGRAALEKHAVIVADTFNNRAFLPNPLLPKTRSEMAVPLMVGEQVIGVLDMQSDKANTLNENNLPAFEVLAGQLAVAIQNAALFEQANQARAEVVEQAKRLSLDSWDSFLNAVERNEKIGYAFNQNEVLPYTNQPASVETHALQTPILVAGAEIGNIQIVDNPERQWTADENNLLQRTAIQLANHIENLRLLAQSEKYRSEAEQVNKRLTREGWHEYFSMRKEQASGFAYDQNQVSPLSQNGHDVGPLQSHPIYVRDEQIGELAVEQNESLDDEVNEILAAVTQQLSSHIENLRLLEQTEISRMEVQKSQEQYALAVEGSNDGLWDWDIPTNQVYFSPRWKEMVGYNEDELNNGFADFEKLLHPEDHDRVMSVVGDYMAGKIPAYDVEFRFHHKDGSYRWIRARGKLLRNESGAPQRMAGSHTDITELISNREEIRASQKRSQTILESVTIPMVITRLSDNTLTFINNPALEATQFIAEDVIGKPTPNFYYQIEQRNQFIAELQAKGEVDDMAVQILRADGQPIWVLLSARIFDFENEKSIITTFVDITERIHAQEAIAKRASELQTVAAVSRTTSTVLNPDALLQTVVNITKERFDLYHAHIYLLDENWNTLLLASGAGQVGSQMVESGHAIDMNAERSLVARSVREKQPIIINDVHSEVGFLPNPLLPETRAEMAVPMIVGERVLGVFDVQSNKVDGFSTEDASIYSTLASQVAVALQNARLYQEQAATVTQLRELDRLKSSFLANMSHELRTPLNSILGFTEVMLEGLDGPLTPNMDNDLKLINKNGQHLLHLINDVLDMAKIESGKLNLILEKFNLHEIFEEVINITSPFASEKKLTLKIDTKSDSTVDINADRTRIRQVMINLVNNALKFTETGKIIIRAVREDNNVLISVKDTGISIPPQHLEDVFSEFTQVDSSTTRKVGGTGLGLPISRKLIEMHGGKIWAESSGVAGEGSTFFIFMPLESRTAISEPVTRKID